MCVGDLIYEVGMNNGDDTAHYLAKGFRVLAVEADPAMGSKGAERFGQEIREGRLRILNVAIAEERGVRDFWVSETSEWSSFDRNNAGKCGRRCRAIEVKCVPFRDILEEFGVPHYVKIDIEGNDGLCLDGLSPTDLPQYLSLELCKLSDLTRLGALGFNAFKLIRQDEFLPIRFEDLTSLRSLAKLKLERRPGLRRLISGLAVIKRPFSKLFSLLVPRRREKSNGSVSFPYGSSGPFGEDTPGEWRSLDETAFDWLSFRRLGFHHFHGLSYWFDVHATRKPTAPSGKLARVRSGAILSEAAWIAAEKRATLEESVAG